MTIQARFSGVCPECGERWQPGDLIRYGGTDGRGFYDRERLSPDMPGRDASEGATPNPYRCGTDDTEEADR